MHCHFSHDRQTDCETHTHYSTLIVKSKGILFSCIISKESDKNFFFIICSSYPEFINSSVSYPAFLTSHLFLNIFTEPRKKRKFLHLMLVTTNYFPLSFQADFAYFRNGDAFTVPCAKVLSPALFCCVLQRLRTKVHVMLVKNLCKQ